MTIYILKVKGKNEYHIVGDVEVLQNWVNRGILVLQCFCLDTAITRARSRAMDLPNCKIVVTSGCFSND